MDCYKCDLIEPMDLSLLIVFDPHILQINIYDAFDPDVNTVRIYWLSTLFLCIIYSYDLLVFIVLLINKSYSILYQIKTQNHVQKSDSHDAI